MRRTKTTLGSKLAVFALFLAVLAGSPLVARDKEKPGESGAFGIVAGTVFREPGLSLAGAEVTLTPEGADASKRLRPQRQTTDARGEFAFRVPAEPGRYRVTASAKRFQMQEKTVEIRGEERTDVTLTLAESSKR